MQWPRGLVFVSMPHSVKPLRTELMRARRYKEMALHPTLDEAKNTFRRLLNERAHSQCIIDLLVDLRARANLSVDDTGWILWNLCDRYALLRDAKSQYKCHSEFHEWSKDNLFPLRLHWIVSDATQALTLIDGGFLEFWRDCYEFANSQSPLVAQNRTVRFESHRANACACIRFRQFARAETALNAMETLLAEDPSWHNGEFAAITHMTLFLEFCKATDRTEDMARIGQELQERLDHCLSRSGDLEDTASEPSLLGSWEQLNADRPRAAVYIAATNAACAFKAAEQFLVAERLFRLLEGKGRTLNAYGQARYLLSCWQNRRDKNELIQRLGASQVLTRSRLKQFAPELGDVLKAKNPDCY